MRILIAGCGYVGLRLAAELQSQGHDVFGLRRQPPSPLPFLSWITADLTRPDWTLPAPMETLVLAAGLQRDQPERYHELFVLGYSMLLEKLRREGHPIRRVLMVSTTGVFAETQGGWVDEASPVQSVAMPGRLYLEAESRVGHCGWPAVIARLSGIYGPGRIRLIREVREQRARYFPPPPHYLNHLHVEDAAGALTHLLTIPQPEDLYVISDDEPADRNDVIGWISKQLDLPIPPAANPEEARPIRRSGNKRCSSRRLITSGYPFRYPTYREGYAALLDGPAQLRALAP